MAKLFKRVKELIAKKSKTWKTVVLSLAAIIVFATTYALILPAITLEIEEAMDMSGMDVEPVGGDDFSMESPAEISPADGLAAESNEADFGDDFSSEETGTQTEQEKRPLIYDTDEFRVSVVFDGTAEIPEGTKLEFSELDEEEAAFYENATLQKLEETLPGSSEVVSVFHRIRLVHEDSRVIPDEPADIRIEYWKHTREHLDERSYGIHFSTDMSQTFLSENNEDGTPEVGFTDHIITSLTLKQYHFNECSDVIGLICAKPAEEEIEDPETVSEETDVPEDGVESETELSIEEGKSEEISDDEEPAETQEEKEADQDIEEEEASADNTEETETSKEDQEETESTEENQEEAETSDENEEEAETSEENEEEAESTEEVQEDAESAEEEIEEVETSDENAEEESDEKEEDDFEQETVLSEEDYLIRTWKDEKVEITAYYKETAEIPEEAEFRAREITREEEPERFDSRMEEAGVDPEYLPQYETEEWDKDLDLTDDEDDEEESLETESEEEEKVETAPQALLYDIGFYIGDEEIEPNDTVIMTIRFLGEEYKDVEQMVLYHFSNKGMETIESETVTDKDGEQAESYAMESFSDFVLAPVPVSESGTAVNKILTQCPECKGACNLQWQVYKDGTAMVYAKATDKAGTIYHVHDTIDYNGYRYQVTDIHKLSAQAIAGKSLVFDDDLVKKMLGTDGDPLERVIDQMPQELRDGLEGYIKGTENEDSRYEIFKKAEYDEESQQTNIILKYFQKMKWKVPLDFIFVCDDSGTMSTIVSNTGYNNLTYKASQSIWCRIVLQVILQRIMGLEERGYDIRMAPVAFATYATYTPGVFYDNYKDAKAAISSIYSSTSCTEHYRALDAVEDLAQTSINQKRNPVVVYLSDFHCNANTDNAKKTAARVKSMVNPETGDKLHIYTVHMFEPDYRYDRNIASDLASMYITTDISAILGAFDTITKEAMGYYVGKNIRVEDTLTDVLAQAAGKNKVVSAGDGQSGNKGNQYFWTFTDDDGNRMKAGELYTRTITVPMDKNKVFSGDMDTNAAFRITKTVEEDDGSVHTDIQNQAEQSPKLNKGVTFVLRRLGDGGSKTEEIIPEADFELKNADGTLIKKYRTDQEGQFIVLYEECQFKPGKSYTLAQINTDDMEDETPAMICPEGSWTLTVNADYTITATTNSGKHTPDLTVKDGKFLVWNEPQSSTYPKLIPLTVRKVWDNAGPKTDVYFTIYGISKSGKEVPVNAYNIANSAEAVTVQSLTQEEFGDKDEWEKKVYVPDSIGEDVFFEEEGDTQTYRYQIRESETAPVEGGYYTTEYSSETNIQEIREKTYTVEGGWKTAQYTDWTTMQLNVNLANAVIDGNSLATSGPKYGNSQINNIYNNTKYVYVEFEKIGDRYDNSRNYFGLPEKGSLTFKPEKVIQKSMNYPGVAFQYIKIPTDWTRYSDYNRPNGNINRENDPSRYTRITKLVFIKEDGSRICIYDKNNNIKGNGNNYLYHDPYSAFPYALSFDEFDRYFPDYELIKCTNSVMKYTTTQKVIESSKDTVFRNTPILIMTNSFVPTQTVSFHSEWIDSSVDQASTCAIKEVTYQVKQGDTLVDTYTLPVHYKIVGEGDDAYIRAYSESGSVTYDAGENYRVVQESYTLANGKVVSAEDGKFAAYNVSTEESAPFVFKNTRNTVKTHVYTIWDPVLEEDEDPLNGEAFPYKLIYKTYAQDGAVSQKEIAGGTRKEEEWQKTHEGLPEYGVDGVLLDCALNLYVTDENQETHHLLPDYDSEVLHVKDPDTGDLIFTITNSIKKAMLTIHKEWNYLDPENDQVKRPADITVRLRNGKGETVTPFQYIGAGSTEEDGIMLKADEDWTAVVLVPIKDTYTVEEIKVDDTAVADSLYDVSYRYPEETVEGEGGATVQKGKVNETPLTESGAEIVVTNTEHEPQKKLTISKVWEDKTLPETNKANGNTSVEVQVRGIIKGADGKEETLSEPLEINRVEGQTTFTISQDAETPWQTVISVDPYEDYKLEETGISKDEVSSYTQVTELQGENTYRLLNRRRLTRVTLKKVDKDDPNTVLEGARFELLRRNPFTEEETYEVYLPLVLSQGEKTSESADGDRELVSGADGEIVVDLPSGEYQFVELSAPSGYIILKNRISFTISDGTLTKTDTEDFWSVDEDSGTGSSTDGDGAVISDEEEKAYILTVSNQKGAELPATGGSGTLPYTLSGLALLAMAAMMYGFGMRRRERRFH